MRQLGVGLPEMSENSSALKCCSSSLGMLMKACMAGERMMVPLLACLSRLSRYLRVGQESTKMSVQSLLPTIAPYHYHWAQEEKLYQSLRWREEIQKR